MPQEQEVCQSVMVLTSSIIKKKRADPKVRPFMGSVRD
jgi:hypothetical protein